MIVTEKELDTLIRYHEASLQEYRMMMCREVQLLEQQTIDCLKELRGRRQNEKR